MGTSKNLKRGKDYDDIPDPIMKHAKYAVQNAVWLSVAVMLAEGLRKQDLRVSGVPAFVLDNEPLITVSSYGLIFTSVIFAVGAYGILVKFEDNKMKKTTVVFLRKIRMTSAAIIFMLLLFWQLSPYLEGKETKREGLIYISKDFKVTSSGGYSEITSRDWNGGAVFCKTSINKDVCVERREDIPLEWTQPTVGFFSSIRSQINSLLNGILH